MNIVNTLTLRHIKTHKKRSILTILAIIVSVAMVTAVFTSALSFVNYFANVSESIDGSWHSYIHTDEYLNTKSVLDNDDIAKHGVDMWYGTGLIKQNDNEIAMDLNACDKNYLDLRNIVISEGKMPANENEILLTRRFIEKNKLNWKLGDKIKIPVEITNKNGSVIEDKEFIITAITDSKVSETDFIDGFVFSSDEIIKEASFVSVYVRFAEQNHEIYDKTVALAEKLDTIVEGNEDRNIGYNDEYLVFSGCNIEDERIITLAGFCAIILIIIAIVSIFMIYDSFAVSYQERARYLGMLASVGATKKQKRKSIYFEGLILGLIGIPLGVLSGIGGIWITFKAISDVWVDTLGVEYDGALTVKINWIIILGAVIASAITIFVSSYIPAIKASKTTAIDAIRQANTVKVKKAKRLKTSKLATKLLGYEGAMAVKNYKRNGRRSRNIVFALFMSVVVFLSVTNFSLMFSDVMRFNYAETADLMVNVQYQDATKLDEILKNTDGIDSQFGIDYQYCQFDTNLIKDEYKATYSNDMVIIAFVDNATLDTYLKQLGENTAKYHDTNNPTGILHNSALTRDDKKKITIHPLVDLTNQRLETKLHVFNSDTEKMSEYIDIAPTVGIQTTENYKNDMFEYQNMHMPLLMLSIDMAEQYYKQSDYLNTQYTAEIKCDDAEAVQDYLENTAFANANFDGYSIYNATSNMNAINNILTIVKVFVFGFITLITLISIMNIINTISNSMNERRREFAMIRSIGMTPKSFKRMIYYESFRYGLMALLFALPISVGIHYLMYYQLANSYDFGFKIHPLIYLIAIVSVFIIITIALLYSISKIKDDNIIETLKLDIN